jgi:L-ascorbate metabolism protein UlaG (beta-lactamase superfamily)
VSHYHEDHGWIGAAPGEPVIVDRSRRVAGVTFTLWTTAHDGAAGCRMGLSRSMRFRLDGVTVLHTGDLGDVDDAWLKAAGRVDLLLLPVGGVYTLPPDRALALMDAVAPRWCIPMHYRSDAVRLDMATRDEFVARLGSRPVTPCGHTFHPGLPPGVVLLDPATEPP